MIRIADGPHLDDESRAMLASGRANAAVALFMDSVLALRGQHNAFADVAAGVALETETPADMRADALDRVFDLIDAAEAAAPSRGQARAPSYPELIRLPPQLVQAIAAAEAGRGWKSLGGGIRQLPLAAADGVNAEILRIPAGLATPQHTHRGREYTLCLAGGFSDSRGSYGPGDVSFGDPSITHRPVADADEPCFVLAITDGDLKLKGLMGLLQRLTGQ